jgi:poly(3-hydroxybutyrate) depolymerase
MLFLGSVLLAIASLTVADPSAGCDSSTTKPVEWDPRPGELKLFRVNDRNVRVTVPAKYNASEPAPIIIAFHDQDSSPEVLDYETAFGEEAVNEDAIVVYPTADNVCSFPSSFTYRII